jgi:hypothetical protein
MQVDKDIDKDANLSVTERGFYKSLLSKYGEIISSTDLARELGYKSTSALRQSIHRNKLELKVFEIENRKGKFAFAKDLANWLAKLQSE